MKSYPAIKPESSGVMLQNKGVVPVAKTFDDTCKMVERIPTIELTTHFFWSVMCEALAQTDREKLVEQLLDRVTKADSE